MKTSLALGGIAGFIGVGAALGATVIVPSLPVELYRPGTLSSDFVPAVGLGIVSGISIAAAYALLARRRIGPLLGAAAGLSLIEFKLVEAFAVGTVFAPPTAMGLAGHALAWLQPPFVALGVAMIVLAVRSRRPVREEERDGVAP